MTTDVYSLYAVRPICSLCCCAFNVQLPCMQMDCFHLFCQYCLPGMAQGNVYVCPFDGKVGLVYMFSAEAINSVEGILANPALYSQYIQSTLATLATSFNFQNVPCRYFTRTGMCHPLIQHACRYDHGVSLQVRGRPCVLGQSCHRGEFCPYLHQQVGYQVPTPMPGTPQNGQNSPFRFHRLPKWFHSQPSAGSTLVPLQPSSKGFKEVSNLFKHTSKAQTIVKIERVQNKRLYTSFAYKHESLSQNEGKVLDLKKLFHGTRAFAPNLIYDSDTGLDHRVCTHGGWGLGTYFAGNSSYSVARYGHKLSDGTVQIFCCVVIIGDSYDYGTTLDKAIVRPPLRPGTIQPFTSVKGSEGGSDIFVVYETHMSYPYYLVTYR